MPRSILEALAAIGRGARPAVPEAPVPRTHLSLPNHPALARATEDYRRLNQDADFRGIHLQAGGAEPGASASTHPDGRMLFNPTYATAMEQGDVSKTFAHEFEHVNQLRALPPGEAGTRQYNEQFNQPYDERQTERDARAAGENFTRRHEVARRTATTGTVPYRPEAGVRQAILNMLLGSKRRTP